MRTIVTSVIAAALAAVIATFVVLAIDDGGTTIIEQASVAGVTAEEAATAQPISAAVEETATAVSEFDATTIATEAAPAFDPVQLFEDVGPSVVAIQVDQGGGTGFFVDELGHIVTNYHVIEGATRVTVISVDGVQVEGQVLGFDRANDLAVVKVDPEAIQAHPARLGDSDLVVVGQPVAAIGNPFGLQNSLTTGVISAFARTRAALQPGGRPQRGLLQTDAAVNPGNSGGVLVHADSEVIGVTNSVESPARRSVGVGFAIPANVVLRFLPEMIAGADVPHPWIGIQGSFEASADGLLIADVVVGAPAAAAGLRAGDRLLSVDGVRLTDFEQFAVYLDGQAVGEVVRFDGDRSGERLTIPVELTAWPG